MYHYPFRLAIQMLDSHMKCLYLIEAIAYHGYRRILETDHPIDDEMVQLVHCTLIH